MRDTIKSGGLAFLVLAAALAADWLALNRTPGSAAVFACISAACTLLLIWAVAHWCRSNRTRLAAVFVPSVRVLIVLVATFIFAQSCLLGWLAVDLFRIRHGFPNPRTELVLVVGAVVVFATSIAVLYSLRFMTRGVRNYFDAISVSEAEQPALWALVKSVAAKLNAIPPKQVILGLEPTFFASGIDIELPHAMANAAGTDGASANTVISGETLYLSLPLMRILSMDELLAVVGHELGHFKGEDTAYSLRFLPAYLGVRYAMDKIATIASDGLAKWVAMPASSILSFYIGQFHIAERAIGRQRELEADRSGAEASSAHALIAALVKLGAFLPLWDPLCDFAAKCWKQNDIIPNMSLAFAERAHHIRTNVPLAEIEEVVLASRIPHPTDTHPTLETRAKALELWPLPFDKALQAAEAPSSSIIESAETLEELLSKWHQQMLAGY